MVSTPISRQRLPISICPYQWLPDDNRTIFPGSSERYIDGTWVILPTPYSYQTPHFGIGCRPLRCRRFHFRKHLRSYIRRLRARCRGFHAAERLAQVADVLGVNEDHAISIPTRQAQTLCLTCPHIRGQTAVSTSFVKRTFRFVFLNGSRQRLAQRSLPRATRIRLSTSASTVGRRKLPPSQMRRQVCGFFRTACQQRCTSSMPRRIYSQRLFSQCCWPISAPTSGVRSVRFCSRRRYFRAVPAKRFTNSGKCPAG